MSEPRLHVRLLGPVLVSRGDVEVPLPGSRKVRGLLAYLALGTGPLSRSRLCDLLWDVPNDPRGELRWCLSKLRGVLDEEGRARVLTAARGGPVALDLSDCVVDAIEVDRLLKAGTAQAPRAQLAEACDRFGGDLLDGMLIDGSPEFSGWLSAQRQRFRGAHVTLLGDLVSRLPPDAEETFRRLDAWLQLAPFDQRAHEAMLGVLLACGRVRDAEEHVAATFRAFEQEGLDWAPLRDAWTAARKTTPQALRVTSEAKAPPDDAGAGAGGSATQRSPRRRGSIAVMPFRDAALGDGGRTPMADGLTDDVITRLAKLRVLFVIGRGTMYALGERGVDAQEAGRILNVDYVVSGSVRREGGRIAVVVELVETERACIVWTDELEGVADDAFAMLDAIVARIVAAIAEEIETAECNRAILKAPSSLDAWEAYHRGLWHMYKFKGPDNQEAATFFRGALDLDPTFARAYAGLSFTHFQNAFLGLTADRPHQIERAFETARLSVGADDRDPAAHWAMGRALWLRGARGESLAELERSVELSPNFALGHYTLGFVQCQEGDPRAAIDATNYARKLSPFDPLLFGMLASRAVAHVRLGEFEEAAEWAVRAAGRPNAHPHILAVAVECLSLANRREEARKLVARIRERAPSYTVEDCLDAYHFDRGTAELLRRCARQVGFDAAP
jgi:TolB-like protein/DNA-binding SARP family transcriptional activator